MMAETENAQGEISSIQAVTPDDYCASAGEHVDTAGRRRSSDYYRYFSSGFSRYPAKFTGCRPDNEYKCRSASGPVDRSDRIPPECLWTKR